MQIFGRRLFFWDVTVVAFSIALNAYIHFWALPYIDPTIATTKDLRISLNPLALTISMFVVWVIALFYVKAWNPKIAGTGIPEYLMSTRAAFGVVLTLAFASLLFKVDVSRLFVISTFITGALLLIVHRWLGRQWLLRRRKEGSFMRRALLVGPADQVLSLALRLQADVYSGYAPVSVVALANESRTSKGHDFAKMGIDVTPLEAVTAEYVVGSQINAVIAIGSDDLNGERLKQIGWALEGTGAQLIVAPALVDFAGNRLSTHPVAGMPFLHVETPRFEGAKYFVKWIFDVIVGLISFAIFLPVMVVTALAIWIEDRGPVFFVQERIGQRGKPFKMFKFRSMVVNADRQHEALQAAAGNQVNTTMFKDPNDSRITKVGRFIRRWSIDELPQVFNVLNGTMSIVGPRPPLPSEVAKYEANAQRRLLVKPGITGLWQVSGRSLLSWDETVRLDLYYVENWSLANDIFIILRTIRVVFARSGAF